MMYEIGLFWKAEIGLGEADKARGDEEVNRRGVVSKGQIVGGK